MRYRIEWVKDSDKAVYDFAIKDWNLTIYQAAALARRMGYNKYGDWAYQVTVTPLDN